MEQTVAGDMASATAKAQRLRLNRILGSVASCASTATIVTVCWSFGFLDGEGVVHFLIAVVAINVIAVGLVLGNWSLRRMLMLGGIVMASYLLMLVALYLWAPERLDLRIEIVMVVAYAIVLVQIVSLGSYIAGLRDKLRQKNAALTETMAEFEVLATRDPLTRLPNRRTAMTQLHRELSRTERRGQSGDSLCLALLDVDHFKLVNDEHGHQAGDEVLRTLSDTMCSVMREGDFVVRFGGEEFLIILPETTLEGGKATAERLRQAICDTAHNALPEASQITVSIGLAIHVDGRRSEETLGMADRALYDAKNRGRNQVSVWCEAIGEPEPAGTAFVGKLQAPV